MEELEIWIEEDLHLALDSLCRMAQLKSLKLSTAYDQVENESIYQTISKELQIDCRNSRLLDLKVHTELNRLLKSNSARHHGTKGTQKAKSVRAL